MNDKLKLGGAALVAALLLTGCTSSFNDSRMAGYTPQMPEEVYPIEVVKGAVNLRLPVVAGRLALKERTAVRRLARQATSLDTPIVIMRPRGSVKAEVMAAEITRELLANGIDKRRIVHRTGAPGGEVVVRYKRKFAVTRECGNWSKPITDTADNTPYQNFGCSQQHNIAEQVDNPEDFERPRVMSPPDADARNNSIRKYRNQGGGMLGKLFGGLF